MKNLFAKYARLLLLCLVSAVLIIPKTAITSQAATGALFDLPQKYVIADHETFDAFTTSKNNINSYLTLSDYSMFIKVSTNNYSGVSLKSIVGESGENCDYAIQLHNSKLIEKFGSDIKFYINDLGKESTSAIKNDRIIFETDIMVSQSEAEIQLNQFFDTSATYSLFNADGTIGSAKATTYDVNIWKHLILDLNFPEKLISLYYDNALIDEFELSDNQKDSGTGLVEFVLLNNNTSTASVAFDNLNVYTVAPYSESISYVSDSVEQSAIDNCVIPVGCDKLTFTLDDLSYNIPKNVIANISLCKDGVDLGFAESYNKNTKTFSFTLPADITPGNYSIKYSAGLLLIHTVGSTPTEVELSDSYEQPIRIVETDKINLTKASDGAYNAEVYYTSSSSGSATLIIAAYKESDDKLELSSLNYEDFDLTAGLNKLTLSHSDLSADCTKAMLWSDWSQIPLLQAVTIQ